ncbi:DUF3226 domain-containing protein [Helicobacter pylori]|uniref:DUF3226 domain-containing protein n=1 Tax=Helicobacter pylori TaxID=210 RepID=UPI000EAE43E2|nr:DUF3226 domain-containing protein [Helicobacter pylori]BDO44367.1 hypothetical protein VN1291_04680 [Helicobacter pylori]BDO45972.1 hypothetical protein CHC155_04650 [Helicobacter pylori]GHQ42967.1 hypothetical protein VN0361_02420 [Helicobacter pylori]GHR46266.1 hypothetical protein VN1262_04640 [Helicobacter pylori]GHS30646.1 hypothetical protein VN1291_01230 [Helicobacter pylori]
MSKKILIYTEGKSDRNFLGRYLNFLKCEDRFDIFDIEGKDKLILGEFPEIIEKILKNKHQTYKQVCIIFDADKKESQESDAGFDNKLKHICKELKEKGIDFSREQIFLFPNNQDDGDLEDLLLKIAKHKEFINCFESYLDCIKKKEHYKPIKNIRKNMLYAYLEALGLEDLYTKKNIFDIEGKVKNEYKEDYERLKKVIKFESDILAPLKNFLERFAENNQK